MKLLNQSWHKLEEKIVTYTAYLSRGSSTNLIGSFQPTNLVVISNQTQGLEVNFIITERGMTIIPADVGGMSGFGEGPSSPSFSTFWYLNRDQIILENFIL